MNTPLINDDPNTQGNELPPPGQAKGYVERDYDLYPEEMFAPSDIPLIPRSEWDALIDEQEKNQSSLEHVYLRAGFENLDQNGHGYCWAYSTGHCVMLLRALANQPLVRLNPHSVAAIIKRGADEGGWCGLSAKFLTEVGIATEEFWPRHSRSLSNDKPESRANMALHKVSEHWMDLARREYDHELTFDQVASCLLQNIPVAVDFNWWSHSVCAVRLIRISAGSYGLRILNSWKGWGRQGLGDLQGSKAIPNGAVALRVTNASIT